MSRPLLPNILQNGTDPRLQNAPSHPLPQVPLNPVESPNGSGKTYAKRGKITIVACVPCRKRKTKCDGQRPTCSQCISRNGQCVYDMTDDQRKLTYLRDSVEQLQERSNTFESLLHTVQNASEEEAMEIFRRLRGGNNVHYVAEQVQAGRMLSGVGRQEYPDNAQMGLSSTLQSSQNQRIQQYDALVKAIAEADTNSCNDIIRRLRSREDVSSIFYSTQSITLGPQPLVRGSTNISPSLEVDYSKQDKTFGLVKGAEMKGTHASSGFGSEFLISHIQQPWTTVTQDQELIEHLVNNYFTWQHSFFQSFPEDLFRTDMANGRTKYCSSALVNVICAAGSFFSQRREVHSENGNSRAMVDLFFDEAVRKMSDNSKSNVTSTATLYLLSYVEGTRGQLGGLWTFSGRSAVMALDINLHLQLEQPNNSGSGEEEREIQNERNARIHAFWGCFHVDQITSFTVGKVPIINVNSVTVPLPEHDKSSDEEPWDAYGLNLPSRPGARTSTFQQCGALSKIVNSTLLMFFAPNVPLTGALLLEEYNKYLSWKQQLRPILAETTDAPPHVLCLHMYYHSAVLLLFRPFLKATFANSDVVPRDVCRQAANAISDIWSQHYGLYGYSGIYMFQVHCLLTACTIHIINLPTVASTNRLAEACNYLQDLMVRNEWARSSLNILRGLVEKWSLILPQPVEEALYRGVKPSETQHIDPALAAMEPEHIWPKGPDTATHRNGQGPKLAVNLESSSDMLRGEAGPQPSQNEQTSASGAKRSSARGGLASSPNEASSQKRQRLISPNERHDQPAAREDIGNMQQGGNSRRTSTAATDQQHQAAANYIYTPLDGHGETGPLLAPVHNNAKPTQTAVQSGSIASGDGGEGGNSIGGDDQRGGNGVASGGKKTNDNDAGSGDNSSSKQGQTRNHNGNNGGGNAASTRKTRGAGKRKDEVQGVQNGVEGLNFGDDWRDPFMGFFSEE